jgi:hypothetical protein
MRIASIERKELVEMEVLQEKLQMLGPSLKFSGSYQTSFYGFPSCFAQCLVADPELI